MDNIFHVLYIIMVGVIDRAHARSTSARNVLLTVRMRKVTADRAHAPPPSVWKYNMRQEKIIIKK